jgi:UDP-2,4-diacetamido-2,4,6-trideoxy-beta-L-altropyranose hydrolase
MGRSAVLFTVADPEIGLGHLFRCDALAYALSLKGVDTKLIVESGQGSEWMKEKKLYSDFTVDRWSENPARVKEDGRNKDLIVVDAYDVRDDVWAGVRESGSRVLLFDDYGEKPFIPGFLVNGSPGAYNIEYEKSEDRTLLLGPEYQVLRPPFWKKTERTIPEKIRKVGVMTGGTDHSGLQERIVRLVRENLPGEVKIYSIGSAKLPEEMENIECTGFLDAQGVKSLFDSLDLLISAAGQTIAEAVSCALPTIMVQTADNQVLNIKGWQKEKGALYAGELCKSYGKTERKIVKLLKEIIKYKMRRQISVNDTKININASTNKLSNRIVIN